MTPLSPYHCFVVMSYVHPFFGHLKLDEFQRLESEIFSKIVEHLSGVPAIRYIRWQSCELPVLNFKVTEPNTAFKKHYFLEVDEPLIQDREDFNEISEVCENIRNFYFEKNNCDSKRTSEEINDIRFHNVAIKPDGTVELTVTQVGKLIGLRGKNIGALENFLSRKISIVEKKFDFNDFINGF